MLLLFVLEVLVAYYVLAALPYGAVEAVERAS
jgi:hypothetical protein